MMPLKYICLFLILCAGCSAGKFSHRQIPDAETFDQTVTDSTISIAAGAHYDRSLLHKFFFGSHHRKSWGAPVNVRVINLSEERGGLTPVQKGGSYQSFTLRLKDSKGKEYVLRSVDKDPTRVLPRRLREGYFGAVMQDQTSAAFPYGALVAAELAERAGIYHTNPEFVFIPHDSLTLKEFYGDFSGMLALYEERADDDWSDAPHFGNSEKIQGTENMLRNLVTDNSRTIDAEFYLKARLLDMLIGDWSRWEDQWRWAKIDTGEVKLYRPIPRDRDHAFFRFRDGLFPAIAGFFKPNYVHFSPTTKNVKHLNKAAGRIDRVLLTGLSRADWIRVSEDFYNELTENDIAKAVETLPAPIYELEGKRLEKRLVSRRASIRKAALDYYDLLSKSVTVQGTEEPELFLVSSLGTDSFRVTVTGAEGKVSYDRIFLLSETKEISLLGLSGDDKFINTAQMPGLALKWYGGVGQDVFDNQSAIMVSVYDDQEIYSPLLRKEPAPDCTSDMKQWITHFDFE